jgi:hypothetical protein
LGQNGTFALPPLLADMAVDTKIIGQEIRRIFAALRKPMGWNLIDAFTRLQEREERSGVDGDHDDRDETEPQAQPPKKSS